MTIYYYNMWHCVSHRHWIAVCPDRIHCAVHWLLNNGYRYWRYEITGSVKLVYVQCWHAVLVPKTLWSRHFSLYGLRLKPDVALGVMSMKVYDFYMHCQGQCIHKNRLARTAGYVCVCVFLWVFLLSAIPLVPVMQVVDSTICSFV